VPVEKRPLNPLPKGYVPPNSTKYKVQNGDTWETVARANGKDAWDLIYTNFKTHDAAEVNWYLREYVGCKRPTVDLNNWTFTSSASPGIIYIPSQKVVARPPVQGNVPPKLKGVWAGLGKSHSGDLFVVGAYDLTAKVYCLGDEFPNARNAVININGFKFGPGLGASISGVFVIAYGFDNASDMIDVERHFDFDIALGAKLADFLKDIKYLGTAVDTMEKYKKTHYIVENAIHNHGITKPGVYNFPIPLLGVGLHAWFGYEFGEVRLFNEGKGLP
jgi:hypothetical protein